MTQRKPTSAQEALARRKERQNNRGGDVAPADWESLNPKDVLKLIGTVTALKGTITFGYTRDGGAYYLSYYIEGEAIKMYVRPTEDVDRFILNEIEAWE